MIEKRPMTFLGGNFGSLTFDAVISENISSPATATAHPIEAGAEASDHIIVLPKVITLEVAVTNNPLYVAGFDVKTSDPGNTSFGGDRQARPKSAYDKLQQIKADRVLFTVVVEFDKVPNCALIDISVTRDNTTGKALFATLTLQQLIVVDTQSITVPAENLAPAVSNHTSPNQNQGRQQKEPIDNRSRLKQFSDFIAGLFA